MTHFRQPVPFVRSTSGALPIICLGLVAHSPRESEDSSRHRNICAKRDAGLHLGQSTVSWVFVTEESQPPVHPAGVTMLR